MSEHFWGTLCEKSRFYAKKSYFFPILRGGGGGAGYPPPPPNPPLRLNIGKCVTEFSLTRTQIYKMYFLLLKVFTVNTFLASCHISLRFFNADVPHLSTGQFEFSYKMCLVEWSDKQGMGVGLRGCLVV